ncbi:MAG: hypothetical protein ACRCYC_06295 [Paraclostridium sp.]|uniref:hypothetical protein n=1 Tax=Paraclostridium sp. TaxID=2023273 RepID=UPI003F35E9A7
MFNDRAKKLKVLNDKIENFLSTDNFNTEEIFKILEHMIYIDKETALEHWKLVILKGIDDIRITKDLLEHFIEDYSEGIFKMVLDNEEAFKKLAALEEYDIVWLIELSEFIANIEDQYKILKFLDNALKTKGNKFAFLKEILDDMSFEEYVDKDIIDELLKRIDNFNDETQIIQLKAILFKLV